MEKWIIDRHTAGKSLSYIRAILDKDKDKDKDKVNITLTYEGEEYVGILKRVD